MAVVMGEGRNAGLLGRGVSRGGVWGDIVRSGEELGIEFTSSWVGILGDERDSRFWVDRWVNDRRLCDRFPRLYSLERRKEVSVMERGGWVDNRDRNALEQVSAKESKHLIEWRLESSTSRVTVVES
ncbi:hypothetical protein Tco_1547493 [Tanacetum coccineum]